MWDNTDLFIFFMIGFMTTVYIYTRSMNTTLKRQEILIAKKEYERQKKIAQLSGRINEFKIRPEFEDK